MLTLQTKLLEWTQAKRKPSLTNQRGYIMKTSVNFSQFCDAFRAADRNENFSYDGKRALYDFLEEVADQIGEEYELDVIALCCEFAESDVQELINDYSIDVSEAEGDEEEIEAIVEEYLNDNTTIAGKLDSGSFVYVQF